jgi:hypothetical protein
VLRAHKSSSVTFLQSMRATAQRVGSSAYRAFRRLQPAPSPRWPALSPLARRVEQCVRMLDSAVAIPGTRLRVGLDPVLGLVLPGVGDAVSGVVSMGVLFLALQYRVPSPVLRRMVWNVAVDSAVGAIPVVGDVFDFTWKANELNFELLMLHRGDLPKHGSLVYWSSATLFLSLGLIAVAAPIALVIWCVMWLRSPA